MFLPETIDLARSENYHLSIRITPTGFMFSISDPKNVKNYCLRETTFSIDASLYDNLQRIFFELSFLTQTFKKVNVIVVSKDYELIPDKFFNPKKEIEFYNFTHHSKANHALDSKNENHANTTVFKIEGSILDFLNRSLVNPRYFHHTNTLTRLFENKASTVGNCVFLNFHNQYLDTLTFVNGILIHSLTYDDEVAANQIYFVLKLWEQTGFDQLKDHLFIAGNADENMTTKLQKYIKNVEELSKPSELHFWSTDAQKAPLDLLTLAL